jgi:Na+/H+ antiporter NhaD/arsenite permease-like protein
MPSGQSLRCAISSRGFDSMCAMLAGGHLIRTALVLVMAGLAPQPAYAAVALDGASLSWLWALPFLGILLTIALGPILFPRLWGLHHGKLAATWAFITLAAVGFYAGAGVALDALVHAMLTDYLSFIVLLFTLYVVSGGLLVTGNLRGTPASNAGMLFIGTLLASLVGTTGASMIMIRALIRANEHRRHKAHVFVFAIFLMANIGGSLTALGNPPLFVGFLHGVDFFWTLQHLLPATSLIAGLVLAIFCAVDAWLYRREPSHHPVHVSATVVRIRGWINVPLIAGIIAAILIAVTWRPGIILKVGSSELQLQNLLRDAVLIGIAVASLKLTPVEHRAANGFSFTPIKEVGKLFAAIFICIIPVLAMLKAGSQGPFAWLLALTADGGTPHDLAYFWLSGALSAFLDNAPTYLVFFELAGGDAQQLMGPAAGTLAAISLGASCMGALTYIGNAPNFMIYAIATERGILMPSFFGFMAWSFAVLLPVFTIAGWIVFA